MSHTKRVSDVLVASKKPLSFVMPANPPPLILKPQFISDNEPSKNKISPDFNSDNLDITAALPLLKETSDLNMNDNYGTLPNGENARQEQTKNLKRKREMAEFEKDETNDEDSAGLSKRQKARALRVQVCNNQRLSANQKLCSSVARGEVCTHGEKCKFTHDVASYLQQKGPELGPVCPFVAKWGTCPFGLTCRFGGHFSKNSHSNSFTSTFNKNIQNDSSDKRDDKEKVNLSANDNESKEKELKETANSSNETETNMYTLQFVENREKAKENEKREIENQKGTVTTSCGLRRGITVAEVELPTECNYLTRTLQSALRKKKVNFPLCQKIIASRLSTPPSSSKDFNSSPISLSSVNLSSEMSSLSTSPSSSKDLISSAISLSSVNLSSEMSSLSTSPSSSKNLISSAISLSSVTLSSERSSSSAPSSSFSAFGTTEPSSPPASSFSVPPDESHCGIDRTEAVVHPRERRLLDVRGKLICAPLTTIGNLPFRRIVTRFGADITVSEMALASHLLQGKKSEWALLRRHESEKVFGVQIAAGHLSAAVACTELLTDPAQGLNIDFVDLNVGCPIDIVCKRGMGSQLIQRPGLLLSLLDGMIGASHGTPITVKLRTGVQSAYPNITVDSVPPGVQVFDPTVPSCGVIHKTILPHLARIGVSACTLHGRSKAQRYTRAANWAYIDLCAQCVAPVPLIGNGDIFTFCQALDILESTHVSALMLARGAIIKPWLFTEIKERRHWDISSKERFEILKDFVNYGLEHWGSDTRGVETTRYFFLNWCSFLCRYVPVGILERVDIPRGVDNRMFLNQRPPKFVGRDDLETLMSSDKAQDWIRLSAMFLGPMPENSQEFVPKHKAHSYNG
jgi:tRNA-dihydrouridine synthase